MSKSPKNPERSFGVSVGAVLCLIAAALWWRGRVGRADIVGVIGAFLLVAGYVYSPILKYPSKAWWAFAKLLGWFNARVLLTVLFAIVLTPIAMIWRAIGKDPLMRRRTTFPGWTAYPARYRDRRHFDRMF